MTESPLDRPVQVAYAITSVADAAARFVSKTGAGPFFVASHIALESAHIRGEEGTFDHSSAYGQWGEIMVELIEEHTEPLVEPGRTHHMAFMVDDLATAAAWCVAQGWPELLRARTLGDIEFLFFDARTDLGHLVELYAPTPALRGFYATVADAARDWDGTDPVRHV